MIENIPIIFEDDNVLVINKPAGLTVHKDERGQPNETLLDILIEKYPGLKLVHRLDKDTSGVMVVAKNEMAHEFLKQQFQNRETKKVYRAILSGALKMVEGEGKIIDLPIGRSKKDPRRRVANVKADGQLREAVTVFRLIENLGDKYAYVEAEPKTGRTHQIRVHAKAFNHPIIGDGLYNPNDDGGGAISRQALHACKLTLKLPGGASRLFEAPLPADFIQALEKLRASC